MIKIIKKTRIHTILLLLLLIGACKSKQTNFKSNNTTEQRKEYKIHTIAFYNVENLFHYENDPNTTMNNWTLRGESFYNENIYRLKINNISRVISEIGKELVKTSPSIIGLAEIENHKVLNDLINTDNLKNQDYSFILNDSKDLRGIDVALMYKKTVFTPINIVSHKLNLYDKKNKLRTRDQLVVSGILEDEEIHLIVNHWPSRRSNKKSTEDYRLKAAKLNREIIDSIFLIKPKAKIINMGDFNDNPTDKSILSMKKKGNNNDLFNPMKKLYAKGIGTIAWKNKWNLFDQIMISINLNNSNYNTLNLFKAGVYNKEYLSIRIGKNKDYPYRSYQDNSWTGGYSDHFPVYIYIMKEKYN